MPSPITSAIHAKDIQRITGRSERSAERMLVSIKEKLGNQKHQFVTWQEFCEFAGLDPEEVRLTSADVAKECSRHSSKLG